MKFFKYDANIIPNHLKFKFRMQMRRGGRPLGVMVENIETFDIQMNKNIKFKEMKLFFWHIKKVYGYDIGQNSWFLTDVLLQISS